jgi:2-methylcitrate dehydratase
MDRLVDLLTSYAASLDFGKLPKEVVHQAKRLIIDALGCAAGGFTGEPAKIAREVAGITGGPPSATVLGTGQKTSPDMAAFANGTMIRYLDYNDTYMSRDTCHPSDNLAAVLAGAEAAGADGKALLTGLVLAYEVQCRLCDAVSFRSRGWDQGTYGVLSSTLGTARAMGLSREEMAQALSIACASSISLVQTRIGTVSMWKGCAMANAARQALFAILLASRGMTGPDPIFEGAGGFFRAVAGTPFQLEPLGGDGRPFKIMEVRIKPFPAGYFSQSAIEGAIELRQRLRGVEEIARVRIDIFDIAALVMAGDPEKWDPKTRETADHSLPYVVAVALTYGTVGLEHFSEEVLRNPAILELVRKVEVHRSEECQRDWPEATLSILEVTTTGGERHSTRVRYHKGHPKRPMSDREVEDKFRRLSQGLFTPRQMDAILDQLWHLEEVRDIRGLVEMFQA